KLGKDAPSLSSTGQLVPPALERFVGSLLSRDIDQRPTSAADALRQLDGIYGAASTRLLTPSRQRAPVVTAIAAVIATALIGVAVWGLRGRTAPSTSAVPPVVAVLPLVNISGDASKDYLSAGIAES